MSNQLHRFFDSSPIATDNPDALPEEIKLLPVGTFNTDKYGPLEITDELIGDFIRNFNAGVPQGGVPIDIEHSKSAAAGWIKNLTHRMGDGLYGAVEWTKLGREQLTERICRFFSAEYVLGLC